MMLELFLSAVIGSVFTFIALYDHVDDLQTRIKEMKDTIIRLHDEKDALEAELEDSREELEEAEQREEDIRAERATAVRALRGELEQKDREIHSWETNLVCSWVCFIIAAFFTAALIFVSQIKSSPLVTTPPYGCPQVRHLSLC